MNSKNISLREPVYERLDGYRRDDESFSDAVERMLGETRPDWHEFVGTLSTENAERAKELIEERRERSIPNGGVQIGDR